VEHLARFLLRLGPHYVGNSQQRDFIPKRWNDPQ